MKVYIRILPIAVFLLMGTELFGQGPADVAGVAVGKDHMKAAVDYCFRADNFASGFYEMAFEPSKGDGAHYTPESFMNLMVAEIQANGIDVVNVNFDTLTALIRLNDISNAGKYLKLKVDEGEIIQVNCLPRIKIDQCGY